MRTTMAISAPEAFNPVCVAVWNAGGYVRPNDDDAKAIDLMFEFQNEQKVRDAVIKADADFVNPPAPVAEPTADGLANVETTEDPAKV
jgi:hypothetical protein